MWWSVLVWSALFVAAIPTAMFLCNLFFYRRPAPVETDTRFAVSILIPARNEERTIETCVRAALKSANVDLEVMVLDDHSEDDTAAVVRRIAAANKRLRLGDAPTLPPGWCGKQHACAVLAEVAANPVLCFLDADVRVTPDCVAAMTAEMYRRGAKLISGFPHQETCTWSEQLLIPLMHFILLGFLPMFAMRKSADPRYSAGCGQIFIADREAYRIAGGHAAIRASRHDGIALPRRFRQAGFLTELCDITALASCRMYRNASEVISGLLKNATEGLGAPRRIVPFSLVLFGGQVLPFLLLIKPGGIGVLSAVLLAYLPRLIAVFQFRQPLFGALLHPLSILWLLAIQWLALARSVMGLPSVWKGRSYAPNRGAESLLNGPSSAE